jgi:poly(A) polymerase
MPVLLPVGTGLLATANVTETTMKIIQKELRRGVKTAKQVELFRVHWSDAYNSARFFQRHRHYLEFDFMAKTKEVYDKWLVWANQQVQGLVHLFEDTSKDIVTLRPWPEWLEFKEEKWAFASAFFCALLLERGTEGDEDKKRNSFDLREPVVKFLEATAAWPEAEKYSDQFELEVRHVKIDKLEQWLDNRDKGLVAHRPTSPTGLFLQTVGEKTSEVDVDDSVLCV